MEETEIIKGCGRGDNSARKRLYELYAGQLYAVCVRYIGDKEAAQDVLHDVFLRIFRSFDRFSYRGEGSLRAWMMRITVNESLEYLRGKAVMSDYEAMMENLPDVVEGEDESLEQIPHEVLMDFIRELPDGYRTVFNLYVFEEKGHREIARLLGITEHTSSSQLARARALLIKKVNNYKKRYLR